MGSDGNENIKNLTYDYSINSKNLTLYYVKQQQEDEEEEILYTYFIPKIISQNNSKTYNLYQDSGEDNNSLMSKTITNGLIVYFSAKNDVKEWVVNDLDICIKY